MGKRELLLIIGFVVLGAVVYQATAPPPDPGEEGFSISRIFHNIRREMRANSASARLVNPVAHAVPAEVTELRVDPRSRGVTITGGDSDSVEGELSVHSTGSDEAEARRLASETVVQFEQTGSVLFARVYYPTGGRQTTELTLSVPSRLRVRVSPNSGKLQASKLAGLELDQARGETIVEDISGAVTLQHRGGELRVSRVGALNLTARGSTVQLAQVSGTTTLNVQAGELTATGLAGSIELESTGAQVTLEGLEKTTGPIRANTTAGELTLRGVAAETQVDARAAEVNIAVHAPALITVISDAGGEIRIAPPAGGFSLTAETRAGDITIDPPELLGPLALEANEDAAGKRLRGDVNGGGPLLSIRARGDIVFAAAAARAR
jgi:hypothetical protein